MKEASKTWAVWGDEVRALFKGKGIDIGAGGDTISPSARSFDVEDGDANRIDEYFTEPFDYVFSSHCLEHMKNPPDALQRWWKMVKPGGHLIFLVPDEDLYEQGYWPSVFNDDHKFTFTLRKTSSWSPVSFNVLDLIASLPNAEVIEVSEQSNGYDHSFLTSVKLDQKSLHLRTKILRRISKFLRLFGIRTKLTGLARHWNLPIDQTTTGALAQIQVILRKNETTAG